MKKLLPILILIISLSLSACGQGSAPAQPVPTEPDVFKSDLTAIDFIEGLWTDGRGKFIAASRGEGDLIAWNTNISLPAYDLYVLADGVLRGGNADGSITQLLSFAREDDDTITVTELLSGETGTYIRDSYYPDASSLDNSYVFWTLDHAVLYLSGMWMDDEGCYLTLSVIDGSVSVSSSLPMPDCDYIDFYDGVLCGFTEKSGSTERTEIFRFDIIDADKVNVTSCIDGTLHELGRLSHELDPSLLDSRYVFSGNERAFAFLEGTWRDEHGNYFLVENTGGKISWNTNLPLDTGCLSYGFEDGGLVGTVLDDDGKEQKIRIYDFRIIDSDNIEVSYYPDDKEAVSLQLTRQK